MIDITKPCRTKIGTDVTELHEIADRFVGNVLGSIAVWDKDGRSTDGVAFDLINAPAPRIIWLNVYPPDGRHAAPITHLSRSSADGCAAPSRLHVLRINLDTAETVREPS